MNESTELPFFESPIELVTESSNSSANILVGEELQYWIDTLESYRCIAQKILVPIIFSIGAFGNSITIAVMTRKHMQTSTNLYLTALAISDIMYLCCSLALSFRYYDTVEKHKNFGTYLHFYRYVLWLTDASSDISIWLTVAFTIERYIAVCHPMKGKVFCTQSRAKKIIFAVYILSFIATATIPHEQVVVNSLTNGTQVDLFPSELAEQEPYKTGYNMFITVVFIAVPLILLAAFNTLLIVAVKRSRKQRTVMTTGVHRDTHSTQEYKITIMLIAIVLFLFVCQLPTGIMLIYNAIRHHPKKTVGYYVRVILNNFINLLPAINAAVNFIFYSVFSDRYRKTFLQTFCKKWYEKHYSSTPSWMVTTAYSNFEDGSPKTSFRSSFTRNSRKSSYRSSPTTTPRASPSRSIRGLERRHTGGSFLRVPPRSIPSTQEEEKSLDYSSDSRTEDTASNDSNQERYLLKQVFHNGNSKHNIKETLDSSGLQDQRRSSSDDLLSQSPPITAESEIVPSVLKEPTKDRKKKGIFRFFKINRKDVEAITLSKKHSIIIKCQKPSLEEQTAV